MRWLLVLVLVACAPKVTDKSVVRYRTAYVVEPGRDYPLSGFPPDLLRELERRGVRHHREMLEIQKRDLNLSVLWVSLTDDELEGEGVMGFSWAPGGVPTWMNVRSFRQGLQEFLAVEEGRHWFEEGNPIGEERARELALRGVKEE